jgi:hypothetical protein
MQLNRHRPRRRHAFAGHKVCEISQPFNRASLIEAQTIIGDAIQPDYHLAPPR